MVALSDDVMSVQLPLLILYDMVFVAPEPFDFHLSVPTESISNVR